ncbi:MAG: hypothetical protein J0L76_07540 [Rhodobacterales bacterium]|nr:hypothetical protein [Rhodobacterales bacterium]
MKRIVLATALVAASGFGAMAQEAPLALTSAVQSQILSLLPDADLSNLTSSQYSRLTQVVTNPDNLKPSNDPKGQIQVILGAQ